MHLACCVHMRRHEWRAASIRPTFMVNWSVPTKDPLARLGCSTQLCSSAVLGPGSPSPHHSRVQLQHIWYPTRRLTSASPPPQLSSQTSSKSACAVSQPSQFLVTPLSLGLPSSSRLQISHCLFNLLPIACQLAISTVANSPRLHDRPNIAEQRGTLVCPSQPACRLDRAMGRSQQEILLRPTCHGRIAMGDSYPGREDWHHAWTGCRTSVRYPAARAHHPSRWVADC